MSGTPAYGEDYFRSGGYQGLNTGPTGKFFWARRFYASLVRRYCSKGGSVLEIGCGLGHVLARLQDDFTAVGIDVSEFAVEEARKQAPRARVEVKAAEDVGQLGVTFDGIIAVHVFEHLAEPIVGAVACRDVLAPSGRLIVATPNLGAPLRAGKGQRWYGYKDTTHISMKRLDEWRVLFEQAGLTLDRVFGDGMWDVPYVPILPSALQLALFGAPAILQTVTCRPLIPAALSESLIMVLRRAPV